MVPKKCLPSNRADIQDRRSQISILIVALLAITGGMVAAKHRNDELIIEEDTKKGVLRIIRGDEVLAEEPINRIPSELSEKATMLIRQKRPSYLEICRQFVRDDRTPAAKACNTALGGDAPMHDIYDCELAIGLSCMADRK